MVNIFPLFLKKKNAPTNITCFFKKMQNIRKNRFPKDESKNVRISASRLKSLPKPLPAKNRNGNEVGWHLVEGYLNKENAGHILQLFVQRDPKADPIIDLVIVNEVHNVFPLCFTRPLFFFKSKTLKYNAKREHGQTNIPKNNKTHMRITQMDRAKERDKMYLCYKTRDRKHFESKHEIFLNPQILDRYPDKEYPEFPLSESFAMFCFPRGIEIVPGKLKTNSMSASSSLINVNTLKEKISSKTKQFIHSLSKEKKFSFVFFDSICKFYYSVPLCICIYISKKRKLRSSCFDCASFDSSSVGKAHSNNNLAKTAPMDIYTSRQHTFVLSNDQNDRMYGACVIFYEEHPRTPVFLNHVYRVSCSPANNVPLERYVSHFVHNVPLPLSGHPGVIYQLGVKTIQFCLSHEYDLPTLNFSLQILFRCLSIDDVITLIGLVLMERKIVLVSKHYHIITPVAEAIRALIFPFQWKYTLLHFRYQFVCEHHVWDNTLVIPVLPEKLKVCLEAVVPFVVGIHRSFYDEVFLADD
ncbi:hypothetical protein RFI_24479, partial [Reticulomyxa filosa]